MPIALKDLVRKFSEEEDRDSNGAYADLEIYLKERNKTGDEEELKNILRVVYDARNLKACRQIFNCGINLNKEDEIFDELQKFLGRDKEETFGFGDLDLDDGEEEFGFGDLAKPTATKATARGKPSNQI